MKIEIRNRCSDFTGYRAARVKSLFNAESGCNFDLDADLDIDANDWRPQDDNDLSHIASPTLPGPAARQAVAAVERDDVWRQ